MGFGQERPQPGASEFFRAEHGDHEVDEGSEGNQADEEVFHGGRRTGEDGKGGRAQRIFRQK